jgi:hypothetical protein
MHTKELKSTRCYSATILCPLLARERELLLEPEQVLVDALVQAHEPAREQALELEGGLRAEQVLTVVHWEGQRVDLKEVRSVVQTEEDEMVVQRAVPMAEQVQKEVRSVARLEDRKVFQRAVLREDQTVALTEDPQEDLKEDRLVVQKEVQREDRMEDRTEDLKEGLRVVQRVVRVVALREVR